MRRPSYGASSSKVLKGDLRIPQTFSNVDNSMKTSLLCAFGPYRLDFERRLLLHGGEPVPLHQKALEILIVLVQHRGEVVSKDELMKAVWPDAFVEEANLSQNVFVLRKALGERAQENRYIATIPGRGYSFVASLEEPVECADDLRQETLSDHVVDQPFTYSKVGPWTFWWLRVHPTLRRAWIVTLLVVGPVFVFGLMRSLPRLARYYNNRGVVHQQTGDIRGAIEDYRWALRFSSGYVDAHYNLGDAYEEIPNYDKAVEQYQRTIDVDPTFYPAYNNLARLFIMRRRDFGAALVLLDRALSLQPREPSVRYTLYKNYGWANFGLGHLGQAEQNLRLAKGMDPRRGSAHCLLAKVLEGQRRAADAVPEWESCLANSNQSEVEPEWRNEAQENLREAPEHLRGGPK
jgi:DNA-binding winged helix-turn-helix (wHTH) protein/Tfp pilus assembly protein PilF